MFYISSVHTALQIFGKLPVLPHRMADLLEKEALEAWDERKRKARVMGETAATKLLVPMIMMLVVVMAIIMIPAFLSFYG